MEHHTLPTVRLGLGFFSTPSSLCANRQIQIMGCNFAQPTEGGMHQMHQQTRTRNPMGIKASILQKGSTVCVGQSPQHNGRVGTIVECASDGSYLVKFDDNHPGARYESFSPENLHRKQKYASKRWTIKQLTKQEKLEQFKQYDPPTSDLEFEHKYKFQEGNEESIYIGSTVRVRGLANFPQYNERIGTITDIQQGPLPTIGYRVKFDDIYKNYVDIRTGEFESKNLEVLLRQVKKYPMIGTEGPGGMPAPQLATTLLDGLD